MSDFDERRYWLERHERLRGDLRSVGCIGRSTESAAETLQRTEERLRTVLAFLYPEPEGKAVLDFGCGVGRLAPVIREAGLDYVGIDLSPVAIEQAREKHPDVQFEVADAVSYRAQRKFDLVMAWAVLLHLVREEDWRAALGCVADALAEHGQFLLINRIPDEPLETAEHVRHRTKDEYEARLGELGLCFSMEWSTQGRAEVARRANLKPAAFSMYHLIKTVSLASR